MNSIDKRKWQFGLILLIFFIGSYMAKEGSANTPQDIDFRSYYDQNQVFFFGPGLEENFTVSLQEMRNGTYDSVDNVNFTRVNRMNNTYSFLLSGTLVWDVMDSSTYLKDNATYVQFIGEDGYGYGNRFAKLPVRIIESHPSDVYICTQKNGNNLDTNEGPLRMEVEMRAIQADQEMTEMYLDLYEDGENFVHNSKLSAQRLAAIYISNEPTGFEPENQTDDTDDAPPDDDSQTFQIPGFSLIGLIFIFSIGVRCRIVYFKHKSQKVAKFE